MWGQEMWVRVTEVIKMHLRGGAVLARPETWHVTDARHYDNNECSLLFRRKRKSHILHLKKLKRILPNASFSPWLSPPPLTLACGRVPTK